MATSNTGWNYDLEKHKKKLASVAPNLSAAQNTALQRLYQGSVYSDGRFDEIKDHYTKPYLDAAEQRQKQLRDQLRARGQFDSGRLGARLEQDFADTESQIADNVTVPLTLEQLRLQDESERENIKLSQDVGQQAVDNYSKLRGQEFDEAARQSEITGQFGDQKTLDQKLLDLDQRIKEAELTGRLDDKMTLEAQKLAIEKAFGVADRTGDLTLDGTTVRTLGGSQFDLDKTSQGITDALARASATGTFIDPDTGLSVDTLDKWRLQLDEAGLSGELNDGTPTLAAKMQLWEQQHRDKAVFGFDDEDGNHIYGTNELPWVLQNDKQQFDQMMEAGFWYTDPESGEKRYVMGAQEKIEDEREWMERQRVGYDRVMTDPNTGQAMLDADGNPVMMHVEGTQEFQARIQGRELDLQEKGMNLDEAHRTALFEWEQRRYEGYHQLRSVSFDDLGLDVPYENFVDAEGNIDIDAFFQWADGEGAEAGDRLKAAIGRDPTMEDLTALLRGKPVAIRDENGAPVVDWVPGTAGLEQAKLDLQETLQQNGFEHDTAERIANENYQDKLREGYWSRDQKTGEWNFVMGTQDWESHILTLQNQLGIDRDEATWRLEEKTRTGYEEVVEFPPGSGSYVRRYVAGTQTFEERMQNKRDALVRQGWSHDAAMQQARIEADQMQTWGGFRTVMTPSGPRTEWVAGDQEHSESLLELQQEFEREGWAHEDAVEAARYIRSMSVQDKGYLQQTYMTERKWHYENVEGMSPEEAEAAASADWEGVADTFGEPLQMALERLRLEGRKELFDAESAVQFQAALLTSGLTIGGDLLTDFLMPDEDGESLFNDLTSAFLTNHGSGEGGKLTAEDVVSIAQARGITLTHEQVKKLLPAFNISENSDAASALRSNMDWGLPQGEVAFTPAKLGITALVTYGTYRGVKALVNQPMGVGAAAVDQESATGQIDTLYNSLSKEGQAKLMEAMHAEFSSTPTGDNEDQAWSEGDFSGYVANFATDRGGEHGTDMERTNAHWGVHFASLRDRFLRQEEYNTKRNWGTFRTLLDGATFTKAPGEMTIQEERMVMDIWERMPGSARGDGVGFEDVLNDVRAFGEAIGAKSSEEMVDEWEEIAPILSKTPDQMTRAERSRIDSVYEQMGFATMDGLFQELGTVERYDKSSGDVRNVNDSGNVGRAGRSDYSWNDWATVVRNGHGEITRLEEIDGQLYAVIEGNDRLQDIRGNIDTHDKGAIRIGSAAELDQKFGSDDELLRAFERNLLGEETIEDRAKVLQSLNVNDSFWEEIGVEPPPPGYAETMAGLTGEDSVVETVDPPPPPAEEEPPPEDDDPPPAEEAPPPPPVAEEPPPPVETGGTPEDYETRVASGELVRLDNGGEWVYRHSVTGANVAVVPKGDVEIQPTTFAEAGLPSNIGAEIAMGIVEQLDNGGTWVFRKNGNIIGEVEKDVFNRLR